MPKAYAVDLRWRVVWMHLAQKRSSSEIANLLLLSERSVLRHMRSQPSIKPHSQDKLSMDNIL